MKLTTSLLSILLSANSIRVNAQCLTSFTFTAEHCSYKAFASALQDTMDSDPACSSDKEAVEEIQDHFGTEEDAKLAIHQACQAAYVPFSSITNKGSVFDKEYFDGSTYYNDERETVNEYGIVTNYLKSDPGARIKQIYDDLSQNSGFTWPDNLSNFEPGRCELNAAMCCFAQDRQANDNNGNCDTPYDENCVDSDPADNTDVCYVDMERAPTSSRTRQGYAIFEKNAEEDSHCHGFAWAEDPTDSSARFKGNKLFYISMYDHLTQRGYVRSVPGAPMCACVEQMPVVTRSDCTQVDIESETAEFSFGDEGLRVAITDLEIEFNACQGANNNNNDLAAYYQRLVEESKISSSKHEVFKETVVGETYCPEAIDSFLSDQGLVPKPSCKYGDRNECGCLKDNLQKEYRGTISVTTSGKTCQRWDEQAPHKHSRTRNDYPDANLVENYCRNPDNEPGGAWCYTTDEDTRWEYCDVPVCGEKESEEYRCSNEEDQKDYRGTISVTEDGDECQDWDAQSPQKHGYKPRGRPLSGLRSNYCRNPSSDERAWCYTTNPDKRWGYCDVPRCSDEEDSKDYDSEDYDDEYDDDEYDRRARKLNTKSLRGDK